MEKITNVAVFSNGRALLLYLLLKDSDEINSTYFFIEVIHPNLEHCTYLKPQWGNVFRFVWFMTKLRIRVIYKYRFLQEAHIYAQDSISIAGPIVGSRPFDLIEEGVSNYICKSRRLRFNFIKKILYGELYTKEKFGHSDQVRKIYLTGMFPIPKAIKEKVEVVNIQELWNASSPDKRNYICKVFGMGEFGIDDRKIDSVLITQPLSEDFALTEEEKISLYKQIIGDKKIMIKPHPREKTNYAKYFPSASIIDASVPLELYALTSRTKFKDVYTIFSTAAFVFPYDVKIHFAGTKVNSKLKERYGNIDFIDGKIVRN